MVVQPRRHRLELTANLVSGETIEYTGLDGAFWAHCRLRRWRFVLWNQGLDAKVYLKPPETAPQKNTDFHNYFSTLSFMGGH